jgi:hypothetical protein
MVLRPWRQRANPARSRVLKLSDQEGLKRQTRQWLQRVHRAKRAQTRCSTALTTRLFRMGQVIGAFPSQTEDLGPTAGHMLRAARAVPAVLSPSAGHMVRVVSTAPAVLAVLGLMAGHVVQVGQMVVRLSRKGDLDRMANQISTTRANQISTTRRDSAGRRGLLGLRWLSGLHGARPLHHASGR